MINQFLDFQASIYLCVYLFISETRLSVHWSRKESPETVILKGISSEISKF